ncbi:MAG: type II toxin-antitoxin system VapC family toxin [Hyphomicrobiaceae bacterium]
MRVVVDSCVAVKWFVSEPDAGQAKRLFDPGVERVAPELVLVEVANALWKTERRGLIETDVVNRAIELLPRYFRTVLPAFGLIAETSLLARSIKHPVYDCLYVVAARRLGAQLVTTDQALLAKVAGTADAGRVVDLAKWPVA